MQVKQASWSAKYRNEQVAAYTLFEWVNARASTVEQAAYRPACHKQVQAF